MDVSGVGGLEGRLAVTVQALRDSAQAGQNALKLVAGATGGAGAASAPQANTIPVPEAADPNAPRGSYLDIQV